MQPTFRVGGYGFLVLAGLCGALVTGRPEPALLAAPFAVVLALGLALGPPPALAVRHVLANDRAIEGDDVELTFAADPAVELAPMLPDGVDIVDRRAGPGSLRLLVRPTRWGAFDVGTVALRATDPLGLWRREAVVSSKRILRVHPSEERLRRTVTALDLQSFVGHHTSRRRGEGFEFAELRPYTPGDRSGRVNWRAAARRGRPPVNDRHPHHTSDAGLPPPTLRGGHAPPGDLPPPPA